MQTRDFEYDLPEELIAQRPAAQRDACRLLVLDRRSGAISHRVFSDLAGLLRPGDLLVWNDTKVIPARLFCRTKSGSAVELLFTEKIGDNEWKALVKPGKRCMPGVALAVAGHEAAGRLVIEAVLEGGERAVRLEAGVSSLEELLERCGEVPLPPYIRRPAEAGDRAAYQTVYAARPGAIAAPTAGLHFTPGLLAALASRGVGGAAVTLHVGAGTFLPVKTDDPRQHVMHEERFEVPPSAAGAIGAARERGGRVVAVGTTVVRVLEHCAAADGQVRPASGRTRLMILPPYRFAATDCLITNFHLPRSTLLMLVCAFATRERVLAAYAEAVRERYRFYSYGDAMAIV